MNKEFMLQESEDKNDYFTRAAKMISSIGNGNLLEDGRNLQIELSEEEKKQIINCVFAMLLIEIKKETRSKSRSMRFNEFEEEDFDSILQQIVVQEFHKFNDSFYMNDKEMQCTIGTFIAELSPRAMRVYLRESRGLPVNVIRNLRYVERAVYSISREKNISQGDVTPEMVAEELVDKPISFKMIIDLMNLSKGNISLDTMIDENDERLSQFAIEDKADGAENIDPAIKKILDEAFEKFSKTDMCLFMKAYGLFGEEAAKMDIKKFVHTKFFQELFEEDDSIRAKGDPVKTAYNKMVKISKVLKSIGEKVSIEDVSGCLVVYCRERWTQMIG